MTCLHQFARPRPPWTPPAARVTPAWRSMRFLVMVEIPEELYRLVFEELAETYENTSEDEFFSEDSVDPFLVDAAKFLNDFAELASGNIDLDGFDHNNYEVVYINTTTIKI